MIVKTRNMIAWITGVLITVLLIWGTRELLAIFEIDMENDITGTATGILGVYALCNGFFAWLLICKNPLNYNEIKVSKVKIFYSLVCFVVALLITSIFASFFYVYVWLAFKLMHTIEELSGSSLLGLFASLLYVMLIILGIGLTLRAHGNWMKRKGD